MSAKIMGLVWEHSEATRAHRLVMLALADLANDEGWCDPKISVLARMSRVDTRTVKRAIPKLIRMGELTVERGGGVASHGGRTNRYWIKCHQVTSDPKTKNIPPARLGTSDPEPFEVDPNLVMPAEAKTLRFKLAGLANAKTPEANRKALDELQAVLADPSECPEEARKFWTQKLIKCRLIDRK